MGKEPFFSLNYNRAEMQEFIDGIAATLQATPDEVRRATVFSLNEVETAMFNTGFSLVKKHYALKDDVTKKSYRRTVRMVRASYYRPYLIFRAQSRHSALPLGDFSTTTGKRKGVSAKALRGNKVKPLHKVMTAGDGQTKIYKSFWIAGKHSGKKLVATRDPSKTYTTKAAQRTKVEQTKTMGKRTYTYMEKPRTVEGLRVLPGPQIINYLREGEARDIVLSSTFERFQKRFAKNLKWYIRQRKNKGK